MKGNDVVRIATVVLGLLGGSHAVASSQPWTDPRLSPDERAGQLVAQLTLDEKFGLIRSSFAQPDAAKGRAMPPGALGSAGFVPGVPRLGIPALQESDAGLGVANPGQVRPGDGATALPSSLAAAASWNPALAFRGGAMIGGEASSKGFNLLLAGGINLLREPRGGRNFEYAGEDPLLAGRIVGETIRGIQSRHVLSTIKHYAVNDQETARNSISVKIGERAMRESDLLAFELAIERGRPGAVMCAYNRINGTYACEHDGLLNGILKGDWAYPGFVMSDWGAVHSASTAANAGLDQQSAGEVFDDQLYFDAPLRKALTDGQFSQARLDDMVRRILRSMFAAGLFDHPPVRAPVDRQASLAVAREVLEEGAVLLRNERELLPLDRQLHSMAVIGAHADKGVPAGGGSSLVWPYGGNAVPGLEPAAWPGPVVYHPSSPLQAISKMAAHAQVNYASGDDIAAAAALAAKSEVAVVFVQQWAAESVDAADLNLPGRQDALVEAVVRANPRTVVVLETNGAVAMPWLERVGAVLQAWYPGSAGGEAIARLLFGEVNPSGRLPLSWPRELAQLPRPQLEGASQPAGSPLPTTVDYDIEGADVGYRWYQRQHLQPLFPFGYGLSYTRFEHGTPTARVVDGQPRVSVRVRNTGQRAGADVVQVYVAVPGSQVRRLAGFVRVMLAPGEARKVDVELEPRLLSDFDIAHRRWVRRGGSYEIYVGRSATDLSAPLKLQLPPREGGADAG
ncbi:MAG TPA: glycoside hydrolase family 3 C-terminal domain-containing protein [Rhodanobacter sp.]